MKAQNTKNRISESILDRIGSKIGGLKTWFFWYFWIWFSKFSIFQPFSTQNFSKWVKKVKNIRKAQKWKELSTAAPEHLHFSIFRFFRSEKSRKSIFRENEARIWQMLTSIWNAVIQWVWGECWNLIFWNKSWLKFQNEGSKH